MNTSELLMALQTDSCTKNHVGEVCAIDELLSSNSVSITNLPKIFIVNTDPHDLPGKHWVCIFIPYRGPIEFFDSLGKHPRDYSKLFEDFMYTYSSEFVYNKTPLQSNWGTTCGHFCLFFSIHRCRNVSMYNIINKFSRESSLQ